MVKSPARAAPDSRLVDIATDHIRRFGASRTTVLAIAHDAGMSHANVYRFFPSKAALIEAVSAQWLRPIEAAVREVVDGPDPADDKLERVVTTVWRAYRDRLDRDPNVFGVFVEAVSAGRQIGRRHQARLQDDLLRVLEEGMAGGLFETVDRGRALALVSDALFRFLNPVGVMADRAVEAAALNPRFDRVVRLTLRGLARFRR